MKLKKVLVILMTIILGFLGFMLYLSRELTVLPERKQSIEQEWKDKIVIQNKDKLHFNTEIHADENNQEKLHSSRSVTSELIYESSCPIQLDYAPYINIQMLDMYKEMKFDNIDGGVWKQGWRIEVDDKMWNKQHKLKVYVVPHSHNDPGWIKTFDEYYISQTKHILNNMIEKLVEDQRRKFIWAEISFFAMWWDELDQDGREIVKRLIHNNQLEIVTGGWVMNDEANSHWISILNQLTEGHQWLQTHLNYTPQSSWSIDSFGLSSTQPAILKEIGLQNMLIQRVHYSVKKELASKKNLEFLWRQLWDGSGKSDVFTQLMPFYSYDIPHTCGPDPKICCQFDFKRLPGQGIHCPWKIPPQPITDNNVAHKAEMLLDQYRKKSTLYKTNVVLIPLGDDFRYTHKSEWDLQYKNYQKLFDYMNSNLNLHVQAQFGTLTDYFNAVHAELNDSEFPSLSGDFFTYADRDEHYWSGYYTSRPFYKRMDRILLSYVKAAEVILTLAHISQKPGSQQIADKYIGLDKYLSDARKALALFQHHDGITGTAKDHVVIDYGLKMLTAIKNCQQVIQQCTNLLLSGPEAEIIENDKVFYNIDDIRSSHDSLSEKYTITIGPELSTKVVIIFNSLTFTRNEVVTFLISTPYVEVLDDKGKRVQCQISPVFEHGSSMSNSKYHLAFITKISALSLTGYVINAVHDYETPLETINSKVTIYNQMEVNTPPGFSNVEVNPSATEFTLQNSKLTASFSSLGLLKAMKIGSSMYPIHLDFAKYGAKQSAERSGAYLFLPDKDAVPIHIESTIIKVIEGPVLSSVIVQVPYIRHTLTLYNTTGADSLGLEIENLVDIEKTSNFEIVMRLSTNINNKDEYFTDLNGYQILRRKRFKKLPLQANYYPIPSMAYIEDKNVRLTILTASPLGCASLKEGQIEIMLDRRIMQDDNLGLGQGVTDNHPTKHIFRILLEKKTPMCQATVDNHPAGFPTLSAHVSSESLLNPLISLHRNDDEDITSEKQYMPVTTEFGVDFSLPVLRTGVMVRNKNYIGLVLHRKHLDLCYTSKAAFEEFPVSNGSVNISGLLPTEANSKLNQASLSFLLMKSPLDIKGQIRLCPMDMKAFLLHR